MRDGLPGHDPIEVLAYVRKRVPGRDAIGHLDRIALMLEEEWDDPEDAALLRGMADRLRPIRTALRGRGRTECAQEQTRRMIAAAFVAGMGEPFGEGSI